jgi:hypothetical protein
MKVMPNLMKSLTLDELYLLYKTPKSLLPANSFMIPQFIKSVVLKNPNQEYDYFNEEGKPDTILSKN